MSSTDGDSGTRRASLWVWLAALCALMSAMTMGAVLGWSSPALPKMGESDSTPRLTDDNKDVKTWIGSSMTLGALFGGLLGGPALQLLGCKKALMGLGIPFVVGWILICAAKAFWLIIIGRVLCGFSAGLCCGVAPAYCLQISTPNIRGLLGTGFQIFVVLGILYIDVFGLGLGWRALCIVGLAPSVILMVGMFFMPESPTWLVNKYGRCAQAVDSLRRLRQDDSDIELELKELQDRADQSKDDSGFSMSQFKRADVYKPFIIAIALMFFQQFSGINAVLFYSNSIFQDSGSSMDPMVSTCVVSVAMVVATIAGGLIIDKLGRKILLLVSGIGHVISLGLMGYYYYTKRNDPEPITSTTIAANTTMTTLAYLSSTTAPTSSSSLGWLPVLCLVMFVMMFSLGFGPIPWMIVGEITPGFALGIISSIATGINWLCAFIVTKEFDAIQDSLTKYGAFWMFAGISAASVVFTFLFIPETKGKSIEEMQKIFLGARSVEQAEDKYNTNKDVSTV